MGFRKILASKSHHSRHHSRHHQNLKWQNHRHTLISNVTGSHETKYLSPSRIDKSSGSRRRDRLQVKIRSLRDKIHRQFHPSCISDKTSTAVDNEYPACKETKKDVFTAISLEELFPKSNRYQIREENEEETNSVIHRDLGRVENENDFPKYGNVEYEHHLENIQYDEDEIVGKLRSEIRSTKLRSVKTTNRTLEKAMEAQMSGKRVLQQLSCQSNQLTNIENNCDILKNQSNVADQKISELIHENRSLFALKSPNPFRKKREREKLNQINNLKLKQCQLQQETKKRAQESGKNLAINLTPGYTRYGQEEERKHILKDAQKYQFEPDEDDNRIEIDLYGNLEKIKVVSSNLKVCLLYTSRCV